MREKEVQIRRIVRETIEKFVEDFRNRHIKQVNNDNGTMNRKTRNKFIHPLGIDIQFYAALCRSLDSSLGYLIENIAREIASMSYDVERYIEGPISTKQVSKISEILSNYRSNWIPSVYHYDQLRDSELENSSTSKHTTDFLLKDRNSDVYHIIELKMGGDIDTKKARSEKESIMEQFSVLSNILGNDKEIHCYFATAYNMFGHGNPWKQHQVLQYFSEEELLIDDKFWNFICDDENGYDIVMSEYHNNSHIIKDAITDIKENYL